ncbi:hypothetical protein RclHR1_13940007 [Rhizophagus clarus]|uniref:Uncharacterized protein n=1 Tax=Rhizophagus clarus TaxID=94130 RepID=A0A2Z6QNT1_9GLOM|nr:hypothetical protein RclHR1_13940007 [Rhizophagus clarus]GET02735.1 hypothetical protein GLOIN_2v1785237 [Rhizophagus clarus]
MNNNYNNFNFINDGDNSDLRLVTTDSQTENPDVNYIAPCNFNNNNSYSMMNGDTPSASYINTPGNNVTMSSISYPTTSSDPLHSLPQYTQQQIQVQQPVYQQNNENNIQQQSFNTIQPIVQNAPHQNNSSPFNTTNSQINNSGIFTFEIPGMIIIVKSIFPSTPIINSSQMNHSEIFTFNIPGSKVIVITLTFR